MNGQTHYDPVEANAICHTECVIAEVKRLREINARLRVREAEAERLLKAVKVNPKVEMPKMTWDWLHARDTWLAK